MVTLSWYDLVLGQSQPGLLYKILSGAHWHHWLSFGVLDRYLVFQTRVAHLTCALLAHWCLRRYLWCPVDANRLFVRLCHILLVSKTYYWCLETLTNHNIAISLLIQPHRLKLHFPGLLDTLVTSKELTSKLVSVLNTLLVSYSHHTHI